MKLATLFAAVLLTAEPTGSVQVDATEMQAGAADLEAAIKAKVDPLVSDAGLDPATLRIVVQWLDAQNFHYAIKATFDPDLPKDQLPVVGTCKECNLEKVSAATAKGVDDLIAAEKERLAAAEVDEDEDDGTTKPDELPPEKITTTPRDAGPRPLGGKGKAGIALLAVGGATAITGAVFLGLGQRRPEVDMSQIRDFRPSGYVTLGVGVAMIVVGAVLLGLDRKQAKKRHSKAGLWFRSQFVQRRFSLADGDRR